MRLSNENKKRFTLPFHIVRRLDISKKQYWLTKVAGIIIALLLSGILCAIMKPGTFITYYQQMFLGIFDPTDLSMLFSFLEEAGLLLLVAFALAPVFKMKFWNIGGEGQILISCLVVAGLAKFLGEAGVPSAAIVFITLICGIAAGLIWALIPAIFKAFFNTNETLFTLMMNYVAIGLIAFFINLWVPSGSQVFEILSIGQLPKLGIDYLFNIIIFVVVIALMIIYLKKTKHGYELSVVGESVNTARYVGINVKKVIIRTMCLSGALCGLVGFLLVAGHHHTLSTTLADGRGFTGVLIAWLGSFNPSQMILYGFLVAVFKCGSTNAASYVGINKTNFSAIVTGMFFLMVIASEFFVNYRIMLKHKEENNEPVLETQNANETLNNQIVEENTKPVNLEKVKEDK